MFRRGRAVGRSALRLDKRARLKVDSFNGEGLPSF